MDYSTAFDKIYRTLLWEKLLNNGGINGKILNIIYKRYSNIRSCIDYNGVLSDFFDSNIGLRQGENLLPLLYAIFINDLSSKLGTNNAVLSYLNNLAQNMDITTYNIYSKLFSSFMLTTLL